jgi:hypothetical protein
MPTKRFVGKQSDDTNALTPDEAAARALQKHQQHREASLATIKRLVTDEPDSDSDSDCDSDSDLELVNQHADGHTAAHGTSHAAHPEREACAAVYDAYNRLLGSSHDGMGLSSAAAQQRHGSRC